MHKPRILFSILMLFIAGVLLCAGVFFYSQKQNEHFITTFYSMDSAKVDEEIRIVELSDLHLNEFGPNNDELVEKIRTLAPDLIACVGDMTYNQVSDYSAVLELLKRLKDIAPVYYSAGNHEYDVILPNPDSTLIQDIEATGAVYLDNRYQQIQLKDTTLSIGGICKNRTDILKYTVTREMITEMSAEASFTLLLSHYPEGFMDDQMAAYPFDLVLCGHAHGGQIRLPGMDGIYSFDQGFLPKYTSGMRSMSGSTVVISRGLGDSNVYIPRINNQPELVVVDIE